MFKILIIAVIVIVQQISFAGIAYPAGTNYTLTNPFNDQTHKYTSQIAPPTNFTYSTNGNFIQLNWKLLTTTLATTNIYNYALIWRSKFYKTPQAPTNFWSGYSCIGIVNSNITNFVDYDNIIDNNIIPQPKLQIYRENSLLQLNITAETNYTWFLDCATNLSQDIWSIYTKSYGRGNSDISLEDNNSCFYDTYCPQYSTDCHYFIIAIKTSTNLLGDKSFINMSDYLIWSSLGTANLPNFQTSRAVWLTK